MTTLFITLFSVYLLIATIIFILMTRAKFIQRQLGIKPAPFTVIDYLKNQREIILGSGKLAWWAITKQHKRDTIKNNMNNHNTQPFLLCVHGFHMNGSCFNGMRQSFKQQGFDSWALNLGPPYISPEIYAQRVIEAASEIVTSMPGRKITIVAHSMGGLVTRLALARAPELAKHISLVITLGSPHQGTATVTEFGLKWVKEVFHPQGEFIAQLPTFDELLPNTTVYTIASEHDWVVYPAKYAHLPETNTITVQSTSHVGLLTEPHIHQMVLDIIHQESANISNTN